MNFYAFFRDKLTGTLVKYKLIQGFTISEEYNETLDSATIKISDCPQIDFDPYDDVFIVSEFCGKVERGKWVVNYEKKSNFIGYPVDSTNYANDEIPYFYKHFLIDQFNGERLILGENKYKYTIQLFSETKGLETVQAPNISVTQPLENKISTMTYLNRFLELYNKKIKVINSGDSLADWTYKNKYTLATINDGMFEAPINVFGNSYCPDFTLNNPSLRQILEKFFITKDRIPVVKDDKIYALDITARRGRFDLTKGEINYINESKSSDNFCTDLKRTYSDALVEENSTRYVEYLGFRNDDEAIMTLENMRLETRFPIYKINKLYMCYYKKVFYHHLDTNTNTIETDTRYFLCKQDITPFVKLNSERNLLSMDIDDFATKINDSSSSKDLAKYKMATVGYEIGSKNIEGWGTRYSRITHNFFWQSETKTYIENLFCWLDARYPYGIYEVDYLLKKMNVTSGSLFAYGGSIDNIEHVDVNYPGISIDGIGLKLKHLFFEMEYQGFYNGTVIHSKWNGKDNITINDNPSASLTLLELDGLAQKEKLARYGNKGIQIPARYTDINDIQSLGSVYENGNDTDVVIFHKNYSIYDNVINCIYLGTKDYVLKNYFTTVYAKHRTYNLMSYAESVCRAENQKVYLLLSKDKKYSDNAAVVNYINFNDNFYKQFFSFFVETPRISYNKYDMSNKINYGCFYKQGRDKFYSTDLNMFTSGNSLLLNIAMNDNITSGTKITKIANKFKVFTFNEEQYAGSTQEWSWLADDDKTGQIQQLGFLFGHVETTLGNYDYIDDERIYTSEEFNKVALYKKIFSLPEIENVHYFQTDNVPSICTKQWQSETISGNTDGDYDIYYYITAYLYGTDGSNVVLKLKSESENSVTNVVSGQAAYFKVYTTINSQKTYLVGSAGSYEHINSNAGIVSYPISVNIINYLFNNDVKIEIYSNDPEDVKTVKLDILSSNSFIVKNEISFEKNIYKDNKERIDMTLQFDPTPDDGVYIGPWLSKLSDLYGVYPKVNKTRNADYYESISGRENFLMAMDVENDRADYRVFIMALKKSEVAKIRANIGNYIVNGSNSVEMNKPLRLEMGPQSSQLNWIFFQMKLLSMTNISFDYSNNLQGITFNSSIGRAGWDDDVDFEEQECYFSKNELDVSVPASYSSSKKTYNEIKNLFVSRLGIEESDYEILVYYPQYKQSGTGTLTTYAYWNSIKLVDLFDADASLQGTFGDIIHFYIAPEKEETVKIQNNMYYFYTRKNFFTLKDYMVADKYTDSTLPSEFLSFDQVIEGPRIYDSNAKIYKNDKGDAEQSNKKIIWFEWIDENGHLKVHHYTLTSFLGSYTRHTLITGYDVGYILVYYKDEAGYYNFVLGFEPTGGISTDLYISSIAYKDLSIYDNNTNLKVGEVQNEV